MTPTVHILGISASPRKGATSKAVKLALDAALQVPGVTVQFIDLANRQIRPCCNCGACHKLQSRDCIQYHDDFSEQDIDAFLNCDGLILGAPLYYMNPCGLLTDYLSRMRPVSAHCRSGRYGLRVGGSIAVGGMRNGGQDLTLSTINAMLQSMGSLVVGGGLQFYNGASVWSQNEKNFSDEKGTMELEILGSKVAYAARAIQTGLHALNEQDAFAQHAGFLSQEQMQQAYQRIGL